MDFHVITYLLVWGYVMRVNSKYTHIRSPQNIEFWFGLVGIFACIYRSIYSIIIVIFNGRYIDVQPVYTAIQNQWHQTGTLQLVLNLIITIIMFTIIFHEFNMEIDGPIQFKPISFFNNELFKTCSDFCFLTPCKMY